MPCVRMNSVIATIFSVSLLVKHENNNMQLAYRVSHQLPTGMPGMWPNVLLRHMFCQPNLPKLLAASIVRIMYSLSRPPIWIPIVIRAYVPRDQTG